jgi:hypothetical protein
MQTAGRLQPLTIRELHNAFKGPNGTMPRPEIPTNDPSSITGSDGWPSSQRFHPTWKAIFGCPFAGRALRHLGASV